MDTRSLKAAPLNAVTDALRASPPFDAGEEILRPRGSPLHRAVPDRLGIRRGGLRSHTGAGGRTYDQLYNEARERGVKGRSKMSKAQLERALDR